MTWFEIAVAVALVIIISCLRSIERAVLRVGQEIERQQK